MKIIITDHDKDEYTYNNVEEIINDFNRLVIYIKYRKQTSIYKYKLITTEWNMADIKGFKVNTNG